jgi:Leucine-rich repeat (LRR) protein
MLERIAAVSIIIGTILGVVGLCWIFIRLLEVWLRKMPWKRLRGPALLIVLSMLMTGLPIVINSAVTRLISLGPLESNVAGERHLTLTGWDRQDYSVIANRTDTIVLQMANADVTDETLRYLASLKQLRELDLNNSQITDEGLKQLAELPKLRDLRLARTRITDEGFRQYLIGKESLMNLDLTGTSVSSKTVREWKSFNSERKALK